MAQRNLFAGFLRSKAAKVLTVVLLVQLFITYGMSRKEIVPENKPLSLLPAGIQGGWSLEQEYAIDKDTQDVLKADEVISRSYAGPSGVPASLFVAYFRTQRTGQTPHSPKNCLPGNGWIQTSSDIVHIDVPGRSPIEANKYVVAKGEAKSIVLYWYQSRDRTVASEYRSKIYSVLDSIRYNRSDIALVRVVVPVVGDNEGAAYDEATKFIQSLYPTLRQYFPA